LLIAPASRVIRGTRGFKNIFPFPPTDRDVDIHYGWHESGYVRKIADEQERAAQRQMVPDHVAHQTGLGFTVARRGITMWRVTEGEPQE